MAATTPNETALLRQAQKHAAHVGRIDSDFHGVSPLRRSRNPPHESASRVCVTGGTGERREKRHLFPAGSANLLQGWQTLQGSQTCGP